MNFIITILFSSQMLMAKENTDLKVAVIDTGIEVSHSYFKERLNLIPNLDVVDKESHGTHVSGIIVKRTPEIVKIIPVKRGDIDFMAKDYLKRYIELAVKAGARVVNISGNSGIFYPEDLKAFKKYKNVLFVVAAGNMKNKEQGGKNLDILLKLPVDNPMHDYPCDYNLPNIVCVGNYQFKEDKPIELKSNYGSQVVELFADGNDVVSAVLDNKEKAYTGTSMATPKVTALLINEWLKNPNLSITELKKKAFKDLPKYPELKSLSKTGKYLK